MSEAIRNDLVRNLIEQLNDTGSEAARADLYRRLTDGLLLLAVAAIPAGIETTGTVLPQDTSISVLTGLTATGGPALLAFTDPESLRAHAPDPPFIAMRSRSVLEATIDEGYDALIINPAGPWVAVPREDVSRILEGTWSEKR